MSTNKSIGTAFESAIVKLFTEAGFTTCRRVVLHGAKDEADIHIGDVNNPNVIIECKSRKIEVSYKGIEDFIKEAHIEYKNAKHMDVVCNRSALVAVKRPNLGPQDGYLIWKNAFDITLRARIGDIINKTNFQDCNTEEQRIEKLNLLLSL